MRLPHLDLSARDEAAERGLALVGTAVGAVAGSVASGRERLRQLPTTAAQIPVLAFNSVLVTAERLRDEAQHAGGAAALARTKAEHLPQHVTGLLSLARFAADSALAGLTELRGGSTPPATSATTTAPAAPTATPRPAPAAPPRPAPAPAAATPAPVIERAAEAAPVAPSPTSADLAEPVTKAPASKAPASKRPGPKATGTTTPVEKTPVAEAPATKATQKAVPERPAPEKLAALQTDRDTMASPETAAVVADVTALTAAAGTPNAADLPLENYDGLTLASIRARMRSLSVDELVAVRAYEKAHADRVQIVTMLDNRIARVSQG